MSCFENRPQYSGRKSQPTGTWFETHASSDNLDFEGLISSKTSQVNWNDVVEAVPKHGNVINIYGKHPVIRLRDW